MQEQSDSIRSSQSWLKSDTQCLKKEVLELQRILDEINSTCNNKTLTDTLSNQIQDQDNNDKSTGDEDREEEKEREPPQKILLNEKKEQADCVSDRGHSGLRQPTKIIRKYGVSRSKPISYGRAFHKEQDSMASSNNEVGKELIANMNHSNINEEQPLKLKAKEEEEQVSCPENKEEVPENQELEKSVASPQQNKSLLEEELERLRESLQMIKEQESKLMTMISVDNTPKQQDILSSQKQSKAFDLGTETKKGGNDSSLLVIDQDEMVSSGSGLSNVNQPTHHRRISRQSFGCRSLQDLGVKDSGQALTVQPLPLKNNIFEITIDPAICNGTASIPKDEVDPQQIQVSTPRTNQQEDNGTANQIYTQAIQTPFFSRKVSDQRAIMSKSSHQLKTASSGRSESKLHKLKSDKKSNALTQQPIQKYCYRESKGKVSYPEGFNTQRSANSREASQTPRESIFKGSSSYTSQRSQTSQNVKAKGHLDYSKISKHQSIAKLFESKNQSSKSLEKSKMDASPRQTSQLKKSVERKTKASLQNYSRNATTLKASTLLFKERSTQSIKKREPCIMNYTVASGMTTERMHSGLPSSRNNGALKKTMTQDFPGLYDKNSVSPGTFEKKELRKSVSKDLKAVQQRKQHLEVEKQEKLKQKVQKKEVKIQSIQSKRVEQEKQRKEHYVIQEKTLKIKPRLYDDSRPCLQKTPKEQTIPNQKKSETKPKTPLGQRHALRRIPNDENEAKTGRGQDEKEPESKRVLDEREESQKGKMLTTKLFQKNFTFTQSIQKKYLAQQQQTGQQKVICDNCVKLLSKGLSRAYCPLHNNVLRQTQQINERSLEESFPKEGAGEEEGIVVAEGNISVTTFGAE